LYQLLRKILIVGKLIHTLELYPITNLNTAPYKSILILFNLHAVVGIIRG
jgi:hypothetical protein